jgi:hypothetical protein
MKYLSDIIRLAKKDNVSGQELVAISGSQTRIISQQTTGSYTTSLSVSLLSAAFIDNELRMVNF